MDYIDELTALYAGRDGPTQKYILSQVSRLPLGPQAREQVEFLRGESTHQKPALRHQARVGLGKIYPGAVLLDHGLRPAAGGIWSVYRDRQRPAATPAGSARPTPGMHGTAMPPPPGPGGGAGRPGAGAPGHDARALVATALCVLDPAIRAALKHLDAASERARAAASLLAGQVRTASSFRALSNRLAGRSFLFGVSAALAERGDDEARETLTAVVEESALAQPDLLLLVGGLASRRAAELWTRLESRTDAYGRGNLAQSAVGGDPMVTRPLLESLIRRREGWVSVFALDALTQDARPDDLRLVELAYRLETHELVRISAVRAAGFIPSSAARSFVAARLGEGLPRLQAAALEALARQAVPADELARAARPLLASTFLRARINALLVLAAIDPESVLEPIGGLLLSAEPVERLEGAFLLEYLPGAESVAALFEMAMTDPAAPVRLQAVRSLSRQPPDLAVERLVALLGAADARVGVTAARALEDLPLATPGEVAGALLAALRAGGDGAPQEVVRGAALWAAASLAADDTSVQVSPEIALALAGASPAAVAGALDAAKIALDPSLAPAVAGLCDHAHSAVAARAATTSFLLGNLDAAQTLAAMAASDSEDRQLASLDALLELAALLPAAMRSDRHGLLADALRSRGADPVSLEFARREAGPAIDRVADAVPPRRPAIQAPHALPRRPGASGRTRPVEPATSPPAAGAQASAGAPMASGRTSTSKASGPAMPGRLKAFYAGQPRRSGASGAAQAAVAPAEQTSYIVEIGELGRSVTLHLKVRWLRRSIVPILALPALLFLMVLARTHTGSGRGPDGQSPGASTTAAGALGGTAGGSPAALVAGGFRLFSLHGTAQLMRDGRQAPVAEGIALGPGDALSTRPGSRASLQDAQGNLLSLSGAGQVVIGPSAGRSGEEAGLDHDLEVSGDVFLDARRGHGARVTVGDTRLLVRASTIRLQDSPEGTQLQVVVGEVSILSPTAPPRTLAAGEGSVLARSP